MTVRSEAIISRSACKRRRVSDVVRELNGFPEEQSLRADSRLLENDENCMTQNAGPHHGCRAGGVEGARPSNANKSVKVDTLGQTDAVHLDYGALVHVFERCEGISRVKFGCVCKLWRKVRNALAVHAVKQPEDLKSTLEEDQIKPYDTVVLPPGMYKQRVLCSKPVKLISQASWQAIGHDQQQLKAIGSSITAESVIFWQERAPAILVNADAVCLHNVTVKVEAAAHEYSSIAYGPCGRAITLKQCIIMGSTGLRVPYTLDPLTQLLLKMEGCTIQGVKGGLSGVCILSGQVVMTDSSIHDCTYGMEVQEDGHAFLERTTISFCTECAVVCEGHAMLKRCQVFANLAAWAKGPIVMEEEGSAPSSIPNEGVVVCAGASCSRRGISGCRADGNTAGAHHLHSHSAAGICTGIQSECVVAAATGIRRDAQIRLSDCQVDSGRLTSSIVSTDAEQNGNSRVIRRLMREVYGNPDQDFDDWQIVMLSDVDEDEGSEDGDAVIDSDDQASDDEAISSDESGGEPDDDDNDLSDLDADDAAGPMDVPEVESEEDSENSSGEESDSGPEFEYGSEAESDGTGGETTSSDED